MNFKKLNRPYKKPSLEKIVNYLLTKDILLINKFYINAHTKLNIKCSICNHVWSATWNKLFNFGTGCPNCKKILLSVSRKGKLNPNWQGGKTNSNLLIRNSIKYKNWRRTVFERDNFICQSCFGNNNKLNAHHIKEFSNFPNLRFDINNGITLCENCHKQTKNFGGKSNVRI